MFLAGLAQMAPFDPVGISLRSGGGGVCWRRMFNSVFLFKWQELTGAALGAFLAGSFAFALLLITRWLDRRDLRIEHMRRAEISLGRALNEIFWIQITLIRVVDGLRELAAESRGIRDPKIYFMSRFNFPPLKDIYCDNESPTYRFKSYYLHNKIIWIEGGIRDMNKTLQSFRDEFVSLTNFSQSEWALKNPPPVQRETYASNLEGFARMIEQYANQYIDDGIKILVQAKTYNNLIRARFGWFFRWKHEGVSFKYFRNKADIIAYSQDLQMLERIDTLIGVSVEKSINDARERAKTSMSR